MESCLARRQLGQLMRMGRNGSYGHDPPAGDTAVHGPAQGQAADTHKVEVQSGGAALFLQLLLQLLGQQAMLIERKSSGCESSAELT